MVTDYQRKKNNKWLLENQLETLKIFYERKLLTKEQYEYEIKVLTSKIDMKSSADGDATCKSDK